MDLNLISYKAIQDIYIKKGYRFYTDPWDLNIVGIRAAQPVTNTFGCHFAYAFADAKKNPCIKVIPGTTLPGLYYLNNLMNSKGTAIVKEGWYHSMWQVGLHSGYRALVQINPCTVYRDSNHDANFDLVNGTEETGIFGIDHHHAWMYGKAMTVDKFSAGCQVDWLIEDWNSITLKCIDAQIAAGLGDKFSYGLINERDFA